jgi:phage tail sheath protein FI
VRPGVEVNVVDAAPPRSAPVSIDTWFVIGTAENGPDTPVLVRSFSEYTNKFGGRTGYTTSYDSMETFFRDGGSRVYFQRVFGPAPTKGFLVIQDTAVAPVLRVEAKNAGAWSTALRVAVTVPSAGLFQITLSNADGVLETSPEFTAKQDAIDWSNLSDYVNVISAGPSTLDPGPLAATPLSAGTDDAAAATDPQWVTALAKLSIELGAGQVSAPGRTSSAIQKALLQHAYDMNRVAILDSAYAATPSKATLLAQADGLRDDPNARYGALFAPWAQVPGIVSGTLRLVPYSAVQAALMARMPNANVPAAGKNGESRYAIGVVGAFNDPDREELNEGGVDIAREMFGGVRTYGYRTLADPAKLRGWIGLNNVRLVMEIKAKSYAIAEDFTFHQIDGEGIVFEKFAGQLTGMLVPYYESGALYGTAADEAFFVDVGNAVNTPETVANGEIRAVIYIKTSPFAELVAIDIVKQQITEALV